MTIKYKTFTLYSGKGADSWEVFQTVKKEAIPTAMVKAGVTASPGDTKEITIGYYSSLQNALTKMIAVILSEKEETVSLSEFLVAYTKEKEDMVEAFNEVLSIKQIKLK